VGDDPSNVTDGALQVICPEESAMAPGLVLFRTKDTESEEEHPLATEVTVNIYKPAVPVVIF
jgi:hypothetical protein